MNNKLEQHWNDELPSLSDLEWQAFCYLAGELEASERTQFEARLADDSVACDALQTMVGLTSQISNRSATLVLIEKTSLNKSNRRHNPKSMSKQVWWGCILATSALVMLLASLAWLNQTGPNSISEQMAVAWADQFDGDANNAALADGTPMADGTQFADGITAWSDSPVEFTDVMVTEPAFSDSGNESDWLFAALISLDDWPQVPGDGG
jgi:hypothetical protein